MSSALAPMDPSALTWLEYWSPIASRGFLVGSLIAVAAGIAAVGFALLFFRASNLRAQYSDWRTSALEVQAKKAEADLMRAKADLSETDARLTDVQTEATLRNEQISSLKADAAKLQERIATLESDAAGANAAVADAEARTVEAQTNATQATEAISALKAELTNAQERIATLEREISAANAAVANADARVARAQAETARATESLSVLETNVAKAQERVAVWNKKPLPLRIASLTPMLAPLKLWRSERKHKSGSGRWRTRLVPPTRQKIRPISERTMRNWRYRN
jgi:peptidoglycan hydrolase CwlO-like protein